FHRKLRPDGRPGGRSKVAWAPPTSGSKIERSCTNVSMNCVIVDADPANRQEMVSFLQGQGIISVSQLPQIDQLVPLLAGGDPPRLVIVHIDPNPQQNLDRLAPMIRMYPHVSFFVMSGVLETSLVLEAMHAGVKEFVPLPVNQQKFKAAIDRVMQM